MCADVGVPLDELYKQCRRKETRSHVVPPSSLQIRIGLKLTSRSEEHKNCLVKGHMLIDVEGAVCVSVTPLRQINGRTYHNQHFALELKTLLW